MTETHETRRELAGGYRVVGWALKTDVDDPDLFGKVRAYTAWLAQYADVALVPLLADNLKGDEAVIPIDASPRWRWRLKAKWLNFWRHRANRREAKRRAAYFSDEAVMARVMRSQ